MIIIRFARNQVATLRNAFRNVAVVTIMARNIMRWILRYKLLASEGKEKQDIIDGDLSLGLS